MQSRKYLYMALTALLLTGCGPQTVSVPVHILNSCPALAPERSCSGIPPVAAHDLLALSESVIALREWGSFCQAEATAWRDTHTECLLETKGPR